MTIIKRTNSTDEAFRELVKSLDLELKIRDGKEHVFYAQLNKSCIKYPNVQVCDATEAS